MEAIRKMEVEMGDPMEGWKLVSFVMEKCVFYKTF